MHVLHLDTETHPVTQDDPAPPPICLQWCIGPEPEINGTEARSQHGIGPLVFGGSVVSDMQYNGGKNYTIKRWGMGDFWRAYLATHPIKRFVDVCCGSGAVSSFIGKERPDIALVCNDIHPAAVAVLRGVAREGWVPPSDMSEDEFTAIKARALAGEVSPLVGFAGFGCAYGGSYFAGFARPRPATPNPVAGQAKTLAEKGRNLARADFHNLDYAALVDAVGVRDGDVWYVDPPYAGTQGYPGTPAFDHARFWRWAADLAQRLPVLVSEFVAPAEWSPIWSVKRKLESRGVGGAVRERVDCVFALPAHEWDAHLEREDAA